MIDGSSYYKVQSAARGIQTISDVTVHAMRENHAFTRLIGQYLPNDRSEAIYEAATGPGILQCWLIGRGYSNLEGSDFSENEAMLASRINPRIICADSVADLENRFEENSLSVIVALDFYEHIPRERFRDFLVIAASRLKPGGVLIMRGPNGDSPFAGRNLFNDITHVWTYTTVCLRALIHSAGFRAVFFVDDAIKGIRCGYSWKRWVMKPVQVALTLICWLASRERVKYWGMSLYVYARK